jgi:hypothetical protein
MTVPTELTGPIMDVDLRNSVDIVLLHDRRRPVDTVNLTNGNLRSVLAICSKVGEICLHGPHQSA